MFINIYKDILLYIIMSVHKTISSVIKQSNSYKYKIINNMANEASRIFNHLHFCNLFYDKIKDKLTNDTTDNVLDSYYATYSKNYKFIKNNNDIIFNHIKQQNINITHKNIDYHIKQITVDCLQKRNIIVNEDINDIGFNNIIKNILQSFLRTKFFKVKNELLNKKPLSTDDNDFINFVKNNEQPFKQTKIKKVMSNGNSRHNIVRKLALRTLENRNLPGDVIINIMDKAYTAYSSYISLKMKGIYANRPKYLQYGDKYILSFYQRSFRIVKIKKKYYARLTIGKYYKQQCKCQKHKGNYLIIQLPKQSIKDIKYIEISPIQNGLQYKVNFVYNSVQPIAHETNKDRHISIDLGIKNLMIIHEPSEYPKIIKGGYILSINELFTQKIAYATSILKTVNNNNTKSKWIGQLYIKRHNKINNYFNHIVKFFERNYNDCSKIVIGYNEKWKQKVSLGTTTNRKFMQIPYSSLLHKLRDKFGDKIIEVAEYYTSKCDALSLEPLTRKEQYNGTRIHRGLYKSQNGSLINADVNGAINIMRRYYNNINQPFELGNITKLYNPKIITNNPVMLY